MSQKIHTKPDDKFDQIKIGGWLSGRGTYLHFSYGKKFLGTLGGQKLYRLAKAIVKQFEAKP